MANNKKVTKTKVAPRSNSGTNRRRAAPSISKDVTSLKEKTSKVAGQLFSWTEKITDIAGPVTNLSMALFKSQFKDADNPTAIKKAAAILRQARETTGMTAQEVAQAIQLSDPALLEQAESGKAALPFEIVLRLAAVLGRHDPLSFVIGMTRSYYPELWQKLEDLGIGKLFVQTGREREFANIYRCHDAARRLSDKEFATSLSFVEAAFIMSLDYRNHFAKTNK